MLWRRKRRDEDLERELRSDLECETEERRQAGLAPEEARLAALRAFGNTALVKEDTRAMWGWTFFDRLAQDGRYALRGMRRSPAFTATVALSLALGIGANTAIFSLIDALLLRWLPVRDPQELVQLVIQRPAPEPLESFSYPLILELAKHREILAGLCGFSPATFVVGRGDALESAQGAWVTGGYYSTLGLQPAAGRLLTEADDSPGAAPAAVISDAYWARKFGRNPAAIGQTIFVEGKPVPVVGVTPAGFTGADVGETEDISMALATYLQFRPEQRYQTDASSWWLRVLARPRAEMPQAEWKARLAAIWRPLWESVIPASFQGSRNRLVRSTLSAVPGSTGYTDLRRRFRKPLLVLMGVVGLLLAIACANVANLLLARAAARQREIAVRLAIGASRARIVRQLLTESLLLALAGGSAGVLLAVAGSRFLVNLLSGAQPHAIALDVAPDWRVLAFTGGAASLVGILAGLAPAFRGTAAGAGGALREKSAITRSRLAAGLVATQMGLALLLLIGAGLFASTLRNLHRVDAGFRQEGVLLVDANGPRAGYRGAALGSFYESLLQRVEGLPGVRSASFSMITPLQGGGISQPIAVGGKYIPTEIHFNGVSRRFFETMATPVQRGREFQREDGADAPMVAMVNEAFARRFLKGDPIGQRLTVGSRAIGGALQLQCTVVGVARSSIYESLWQTAPPTVYVPLMQMPVPAGSGFGVRFEVDAAGSLAQVAAELRSTMQPLLPGAPLRVDTLTEQVDRALVKERMMATLATAFGALGLALAGVGLYGLLAYFVTRRTREIGIRLALGARREKVLWMVVRQALALLGIGIAIGVPAAWAMSRLVSSMLFGLKATDPWTIGASAGVLGAAGVVAGIVPAWRASRVDPMVALRYE
jgi:putative ABC transport system permease protein